MRVAAPAGGMLAVVVVVVVVMLFQEGVVDGALYAVVVLVCLGRNECRE